MGQVRLQYHVWVKACQGRMGLRGGESKGKEDTGEAGRGSTVYLKLGRWGESGGCAGAWKEGEVKVTSLRKSLL